MTLQDLGNLGEFLAAIGVIASLLYLAYEIRTNTRTLRGSAANQLQNNLAALNEGVARDAVLAQLVVRLNDPEAQPTDFSNAEWAQLYMLFRSWIQRIEGEWHLKESRVSPSAMWKNHLAFARNLIELPVGRRLFELEVDSGYMDPGFVEELRAAIPTSTGQRYR